MKQIYCLLLLFFLSTLYLNAQQLTGRVTDEKDNPLSGVSITVNGRTTGAATAEDGRFSINGPGLKGTVVFSSVGYGKQEITVDGRTSINVRLQTEAAALNDVIVVGYGTQRKVNLTGAVSQISGKQLEDSLCKV